jgi:hypothetical protein
MVERGGWRWLRRVAVLVVTAGLAGALAPATAWAGGPTSVLLASPQTDRAAALYTADPAYQQLSELLGEQPQPDPAGPPPDSGTTYVTLTWLVHDVDVWRIDRVFLDTSAGQWVVTQTADDTTQDVSTELWPGERGGPGAVWHRPTDPAALFALFERLGVLRPASESSVVQAVPAPAPVAAPPAPDGDGPWWWAGAGGLVGIGLSVAGLRSSAWLRRRVLATARA